MLMTVNIEEVKVPQAVRRYSREATNENATLEGVSLPVYRPLQSLSVFDCSLITD